MPSCQLDQLHNRVSSEQHGEVTGSGKERRGGTRNLDGVTSGRVRATRCRSAALLQG
jgi:hypothetical protein